MHSGAILLTDNDPRDFNARDIRSKDKGYLWSHAKELTLPVLPPVAVNRVGDDSRKISVILGQHLNGIGIALFIVPPFAVLNTKRRYLSIMKVITIAPD
jgi:hypothetical protein